MPGVWHKLTTGELKTIFLDKLKILMKLLQFDKIYILQKYLRTTELYSLLLILLFNVEQKV